MVFKRVLVSLCVVVCFNGVTFGQQWENIAPILQARWRPSCAVLPGNKILVFGGHNLVTAFTESEIYDPKTDSWSATGSMHAPRWWGAVATLPDGRIFTAGGFTAFPGTKASVTNTCEIYDPKAGTWQRTASMARPRACFSAITLENGHVLILGGIDSTSPDLSNLAEEFDPVSETFLKVPSPMPSYFGYQCIYSKRLNGIVFAGGVFQLSFEPQFLNFVQFYNPSSRTWMLLSPLTQPVEGLSQLVETSEGKIAMLSGRSAHFGTTTEVELYDPSQDRWTDAGSLPFGHDYGISYRINDDSIITIGGLSIPGQFSTVVPASWIDVSTGATSRAPAPNIPRTSEGSVMMTENAGCDEVKTIYLIAGTNDDSSPLSACEKLVFEIPSSQASLSTQHSSSASSFFGHTDSLPMTVDVSASINLDSLWPTLQSMSGTYTWDSSVVRFAGYIPPDGWIVSSESLHDNSEDFTIENISSAVTNPLNVGMAVFLPKNASLGSSLVNLPNLSLQSGSQSIPLCISSSGDAHWTVKALGAESGVTPINESSLSVQDISVSAPSVTISYRSNDVMPLEIHAYDQLGREIFSDAGIRSTGSEISIPTPDVIAGIYYLRLSQGNASVFRAIVVP